MRAMRSCSTKYFWVCFIAVSPFRKNRHVFKLQREYNTFQKMLPYKFLYKDKISYTYKNIARLLSHFTFWKRKMIDT